MFVIKVSDEVLITDMFNIFNIFQIKSFRKKCEIKDKTVCVCVHTAVQAECNKLLIRLWLSFQSRGLNGLVELPFQNSL